MDVISRQTIFDMLDDILEDVEDGEGFQYEKWVERAEDLPTAHDCADCPAHKTFFEDVAGQTDVEILGIIRGLYNCFDEGERRVYLALSHAIDAISKEPKKAAGKKTGVWVEKEVFEQTEHGIEEWQSARCSVCGRYHTTPYMYDFFNFAYCPCCGAKMEEGELYEIDKC